MAFSKLSLDLTASLSKEEKQKDGIFFTPPMLACHAVNIAKRYLKKINRNHNYQVLEPSCGSGEFIKAIQKTLPNSSITGIEFNETVYNQVKSFESEKTRTVIQRGDFLHWNAPHNYDLIAGNPPYYVLPKSEVESIYYSYFTGRPNIFILFLVKCLSLLKTDGVLSFVLPRNFLNSAYYQAARQFVLDRFTIIAITDGKIGCEGESEDQSEAGVNKSFIDTEQETILFICKNCLDCNNHNDRFTLRRGDSVIFGTVKAVERMKELCIGCSTLAELGFTASVGQVVWNQHKLQLTDDPKNTRLIYSTDIVKGQVVLKKYKSESKKNYINLDSIDRINPLRGPVIVVNRGYGVGKYNFNVCLVNLDHPYQIENHLILIRSNSSTMGDGSSSNTDLVSMYKNLCDSISSSLTREFMELCLGNNAVTTTELNYVLPIPPLKTET